jgi:hypothetical protein
MLQILFEPLPAEAGAGRREHFLALSMAVAVERFVQRADSSTTGNHI